MVKLYSVAKPLLICGYHGLTIVTMVFGFIFSETTFRKGCVVVCLSSLYEVSRGLMDSESGL